MSNCPPGESPENNRNVSLKCGYEVFLSFCGMDSRKGFTDYMYESLVKARISTFRDDEKLPKGDKINVLLSAVDQSKISIVVLSKNYASREWCLRELARIVECSKTKGQKIFPIFYDVASSVVREQSGSYGEALLKHRNDFDEKTIIEWRKALREVGSVNGWEVAKTFDGYEGKAVTNIISEVWKQLKKTKLVIPDGTERKPIYENKVMELLDMNAKDVRFVGIHGKPGSGKTTLAKLVYNKIFNQFDTCSFIADIRVRSRIERLEVFQMQLIDQLLIGNSCEKIYSIDDGIKIISERFFEQKVLILLDDVDKEEQLHALAKKQEWFGRGSRIIVTTRIPDILNFAESLEVNEPEKNPRQLLHEQKLVGSRIHRATDEILDYLTKDEHQIIGIHGLGGVGKTTLALNVHDCLVKHYHSFNGVYWVTVSQSWSIYSLQEKIAKEVNLDFQGVEDEILRAERLLETLRRKGKFLLFLDDVWIYIPLQKIGLSHEIKECRLILTSRLVNVCEEMGCVKCLKVNVLADKEAWELFKKKLGHDIISLEINEIAMAIIKKCKGLPLAITILGSSMRHTTNSAIWLDTLERLRASRQCHENLDFYVFRALQVSYDRLVDIDVQQCLLFCATYPEDFEIRIPDLIDQFIDFGIIREETLQKEMQRAQTILNKLVKANLLERREAQDFGQTIPCVKMHDLVRYMVLRIKESEYMVKAGLWLQEVPDDPRWTDNISGSQYLTLVSLVHNCIKKISETPMCPNLTTLLLEKNLISEISDSFFVNLPSLKVLDMSFTRIKIVPSSVGNLVNLNSLKLRNCIKLEYMPSLVNLTKLRTLDLFGTAITGVPDGLEMLVQLRYLSLISVALHKLPTGFLTKLNHLRYLEVVGVTAKEVECLHKLKVLKVLFFYSTDFCQFVTSPLPKPDNYHIKLMDIKAHRWGNSIGPRVKYYESERPNRAVEVVVDFKVQGYFVFPQCMLSIHLSFIQNIKSLSEVCTSENLIVLEHCKIYNCEGFKYLVSSPPSTCPSSQSAHEDPESEIPYSDVPEHVVSSPSHTCFRSRGADKDLHQVEFNVGHIVSQKPLSSKTFSHLKTLSVHDCKRIKKLFNLVLLSNLTDLVELEVNSCEVLTEMVAVDIEEDKLMNTGEVIALPRLQKLTLTNLPNLKVICPVLLVCDSLQVIEIQDCFLLKKIPLSLRVVNGQLSPPSSLCCIILGNMTRTSPIDVLEIAKKWWESLQWNDPDIEKALRPYRKISGEEYSNYKLRNIIIDKDDFYSELWKACAGPLVEVPQVNERVYFFPEGQIEQVEAPPPHSNEKTTKYDQPSKILCRVVNVLLPAKRYSDELYVHVQLMPELDQTEPTSPDPCIGESPRQLVHSFRKVLTDSDVSTRDGISILNKHATKCFPPLDMSQPTPSQELVAKDLHGYEWRFNHSLKGQPRKHLLTTGWSEFVTSKRLVSGDSLVFLRDNGGKLRVGVRRVDHGHRMKLDWSYHTSFAVYYNPRVNQCIISLNKYLEAVNYKWSVGMRFKMRFEGEHSSIKWYLGTIIAVEDISHYWKSSIWRSLEVQWDEPASISRPDRVSPWEIEPYVASTPIEVQMHGVGVAQVADLIDFSGYDELIDELEDLFNVQDQLHARGNWSIVFTDDKGNMQLLGVDPWPEFCNIVRKIFICSSQDAELLC